jgi:hypothetical protein
MSRQRGSKRGLKREKIISTAWAWEFDLKLILTFYANYEN